MSTILYRFTPRNAVPTALAFLHGQPPGSIIRMPASASRSAKPSLATFCASNGLAMEQEGGTIALSLNSSHEQPITKRDGCVGAGIVRGF